jgi:VanZ family protein
MSTLMRRSKPRLSIASALTAGLLAFIWINSAIPGQTSGELSGFVGKILGAIFPFLSPDSPSGAFLVRKIAHFSEFAALGMSLAWLLGMFLHTRAAGILLPFGCGVGAACVDETIQIFSPGRYCSIVDVTIDSAGALTGVLCLIAFHWFLSKRGK